MLYDRATPQLKSSAVPPHPSGSSLLYTIFSIVVLSSLAAGIAALTPSATLTNLVNINEQRAYYLALSGLNFWSVGKTGTYSVDGDGFTLTQAGPDQAGYYTVTSTGTVNAGTGNESNVLVTARRGGASSITFQSNINDFIMPEIGQGTNNSKAILVFSDANTQTPASLSLADWTTLWSQNVYRYAGGWIRLGGGESGTTGAIWYQGNNGFCTAGKCAFARGLRTYFQFVFSGYDTHPQSKGYGDGFTFAVMTADNDPRYAAGGTANGLRAEYLGYAGPGPSGRGILPPKLAVEVDVYPSCCVDDPTGNNSRRDKSGANHVAAVYWGERDTSYDDNVHGLGTGPDNPAGDDTGYYERQASSGGAAWLEDGLEHALRLEITRDTDGGQGVYSIRAWVDPAGEGMSDVSRDYAAEIPHVNHTVRLAPADHLKLDTVCFGWTEATGSRGQSVAIHGFALSFRQ